MQRLVSGVVLLMASGRVSCAAPGETVAPAAAAMADARKSAPMRLTVRNVSYPATDPGDRYLNEHWRRRERTVTIPVDQAALLLVDVWDIESPREANPPVADHIVKTRIAPLLQAARAADMLIIHAPHRPIGWDGVNRGPKSDYRSGSSTARDALPAEVARQKADPDRWPPVEFVYRVGKFGQFARNDQPSYMPYAHVRGIHPGALPVRRAREYIESSPDKVQAILKENGILHLLYVGEWTNGCVVMRAVGIRRMSALGYNTVILRDATWGSELADTWDTLEVTVGAVLDIEILNGFSALSVDVVRELERLGKAR